VAAVIWLTVLTLPGQAQEIRSFVPKWSGTQTVPTPVPSETLPTTLTAPTFEGAQLGTDLANLPYTTYTLEVGKNVPGYTLDIIDGGYAEEPTAAFDHAHAEPFSRVFEHHDWYPAAPVVLGPVQTQRGRHYQTVFIYPYQVHRSGTLARRHTEVLYRLVQQEHSGTPHQRTTSRTYAESSVLATGEWFKIATTETGLHRIDRAVLEKLGIPVNTIDPRNLALYGYSGGPVPQLNSTPRPDDLPQLPIRVDGEADGRFDSGDAIVFYAQGSDSVRYNERLQRLRHVQNVYSDTSYYYIRLNDLKPKRIATQTPNPSGQPILTPSFYRFLYDDKDQVSPLKMGRYWVGDVYDFQTTYTYNFAVPNAQPADSLNIAIRVLGRGFTNTSFSVVANGQSLGQITVVRVDQCSYCRFGQAPERVFRVPGSLVSNGQLTLQLTYNKSGNSIGYLDFIEVQYVQNAQNPSVNQPLFALPQATPGVVQAAGGNYWNVSDNLNPFIQPADNGLAYPANTLACWIREDGSTYHAVRPVGRVANQNLHALPVVNYLIITHPLFMAQANALADIHRTAYGRTVQVLTPEQIYNEFSSGKVDPSAIRDCIKMFYDRSKGRPDGLQYVCLFGDGSYDYRGIRTGGMFVPTYQARQWLEPTQASVSDDYYGLLDDTEGLWLEGSRLTDDDLSNSLGELMDISVGRLPASSVETAEVLVRKIRNYIANPESFGDWRQRILLMADHKASDGNMHIDDSEFHYKTRIRAEAPCLNIDKIYLDSYPVVNTAGGTRYPSAEKEIINRLNQGSLVMNYVGHGGETGFSNSYILEANAIQKLTNGLKLPLWITATCDFGRYDDPDRTSGGETVCLAPNGGGIGIISSVRVVYSSANRAFNSDVYAMLLDVDSTTGRYRSFGEIIRDAKNLTYRKNGSLNDINTRNYSLLGDPGVFFERPRYRIVIDSLAGQAVSPDNADNIVLKALQTVRAKGKVVNDAGQVVRGFNGTVATRVFDKPREMVTLTTQYKYDLQNTVLFNGRASVTNGEFSFEFIMPLDINYRPGYGTISTYAWSDSIDAGGCTKDFIVCCTDESIVPGTEPPSVRLVLNDFNWVSGSTTTPSPVLLARVSDDQGINTSGLGIGRDLIAILDNRDDQPIVLNEYYEAEVDNYRAGLIRYPMDNLARGEHTLRIRVWDVTNNSATDETRFIVETDPKAALFSVLNYPNPFTDKTVFRFNHNLVDQPLRAVIRIINTAGREVTRIAHDFESPSFIDNTIEWDGTDGQGIPIPGGLYVYEVQLTAKTTGETVEAYSKLVYLK
jgi:hypothetical protein